MNKKRVIILIIFLLVGMLFINKVDKELRYDLSLSDYYKYNASLSESERERISEKALLAGIYDIPPLTYTNEFNNYNSGIVVDYLSQLAIELRIDMHLKAGSKEFLCSQWPGEEFDIIMVEEGNCTPGLLTTQTLCTIKTRVVTRKDSGIDTPNDLKGKTLVALSRENKSGQLSNIVSSMENVTLMEVDSIYQCFALLNSGGVSGFIGGDMDAAHYLQVTNRSSYYKFLKPVYGKNNIRLAVKPGDNELLNTLNKGILQLKKKDLISQTQYKWLGDFDVDAIDMQAIRSTYKVLLVLVLIISVFSLWNYIITQRVNTRTRELSESKEELRLIIDAMRNGILVVDDETTILECNDSFAEISGIPKHKLVGSLYKDFPALEPFTGNVKMSTTHNINGRYYYVSGQKIAGNKSMIVVEDYTEKYLKEKRERQESKMIAVGQLSAGLAHEVRNPLGLIKNYIYILDRQTQGTIYKHAISVINNSIDRISNLVENLLRFSKLTNEGTTLVDIKTLVTDIIIELRKKADEKDIRLTLSFGNLSHDLILINSEVLRMVLINLINNGIESFETKDCTGKQISVSIETRNNFLVTVVNDNGIGINKLVVDDIFDPFYSTKEKGVGLGLYIINSEIRNSGGSISVKSDYKMGTEFTVFLPIGESKNDD